MTIKKLSVQNRELLYYDWMPERFDSIILAIQGLGACADRWTWMAEYLSAKGIAVIALELDGFGESPGMPGYVKNFDVWVNQLGLMHEHVKSGYPGKKIILLGESLGAMIVTRYRSADADKASPFPAFVEGKVFSLADKMKAGPVFSSIETAYSLPYKHRDFATVRRAQLLARSGNSPGYGEALACHDAPARRSRRISRISAPRCSRSRRARTVW